MNRSIKSVAFNHNCPYEQRLVDHLIKYPNFSSYVKRLIQRDMEGVEKPQLNIAEENNFDDFMRNML